MRDVAGVAEAGATFPRQEEDLMITRSPVPAVAAALLLAIAVAGCGNTAGSSTVASQSSTGTQQTTPPPTSDSTGGSSTISSDGNVQVSAGKKIGTAAYLKSITPIRRQLVKVHSSTAAMAAAIKAGDAPTAGRNAMAAAAGVRRALTIARRIRPHHQPWATIHTQLMANLQIGVAYLTEMGRDLNAVDVAAIHRWDKTVVPKIRKSERWYREWAANVAAFGTLDNVKAPHWLRTMDRWN
jgi:hypothetical protein